MPWIMASIGIDRKFTEPIKHLVRIEEAWDVSQIMFFTTCEEKNNVAYSQYMHLGEGRACTKGGTDLGESSFQQTN